MFQHLLRIADRLVLQVCLVTLDEDHFQALTDEQGWGCKASYSACCRQKTHLFEERLVDGFEEGNFVVGRMAVVNFGESFDMVVAYAAVAGSTGEVAHLRVAQSQFFDVVVDMEDRLQVEEKHNFQV